MVCRALDVLVALITPHTRLFSFDSHATLKWIEKRKICIISSYYDAGNDESLPKPDLDSAVIAVCEFDQVDSVKGLNPVS